MRIDGTTRKRLERLTLVAVVTLPMTACSGTAGSRRPSAQDRTKVCAPDQEFCDDDLPSIDRSVPAGSGVPIDSPSDPGLLPGIDSSYSPDDGYSDLHYAPDDGQHQHVSFCDGDGNPIPPPSEQELNTPPPDGSWCQPVLA